MKENEIILDSYQKLLASNKKVLLGVPFMNRCIDMILIQEENIWAIEFKLNDWRRAIKQAQDHLLGVDESYICLPGSKKITPVLEQNLHDTGVGLILYYPDGPEPLKVVVQAVKSHYKWEIAVNWLKDTIAQHEKKEQKV